MTGSGQVLLDFGRLLYGKHKRDSTFAQSLSDDRIQSIATPPHCSYHLLSSSSGMNGIFIETTKPKIICIYIEAVRA